MSDVASSLADSETRERYILACRLLRARMMQNNPPPILQMERELLEDLMYRFQSSKTAGSAVAYEMLAQMLQQASSTNTDHANLLLPPILPPLHNHEAENDEASRSSSIEKQQNLNDNADGDDTRSCRS